MFIYTKQTIKIVLPDSIVGAVPKTLYTVIGSIPWCVVFLRTPVLWRGEYPDAFYFRNVRLTKANISLFEYLIFKCIVLKMQRFRFCDLHDI